MVSGGSGMCDGKRGKLQSMSVVVGIFAVSVENDRSWWILDKIKKNQIWLAILKITTTSDGFLLIFE